jgi:glycosyltransferase involved in cell wall biosynthesis
MNQSFAIVAVTNDLTTDQRVNRTCSTLVKLGYKVLLVGRKRRDSKDLKTRAYRMHRLRLLFKKGPLFYANFNISLFFYLLFRRAELLVSNDLDTLPAVWMAYRIKKFFAGIIPFKKSKTKSRKGIIHLHDCHEYFRGVPELVGRKTVLRVWKFFEDLIFPRLSRVTAVNQSIADIYEKEYNVPLKVMRNFPGRKQNSGSKNKAALNISGSQKIIFYQGALNIDRGLEESIQSIKYMNTDAVLVLAGKGDIDEKLKQLVISENLAEKVILTGEIPLEELHEYTQMADLGISVEKDVCVNYHYSLPNKLFDYIQSRVPVLVSPFPEVRALVDHYQIGEFIQSHDPVELAKHFDKILNDQDKLAFYKKNLQKAAKELCWECEEEVLVNILKT